MFTLTLVEAIVLGTGLLVTAFLLVAGVLRLFPRATRVVPGRVECPLRGRPGSADLACDTWTLRVVDVTRCSILKEYSTVICAKRCLTTGTAAPLARAA